MSLLAAALIGTWLAQEASAALLKDADGSGAAIAKMLPDTGDETCSESRAQFHTSADTKFRMADEYNFFWREPGTECWQDKKKPRCKKGKVKLPVTTEEDCKAAETLVTNDQDFKVKHVSVVNAELARRTESIGHKRGCIKRKQNNNKVLTWVELGEGEYYGSDVCACLPKPEEIEPTRLTDAIKQLLATVKEQVVEDRFQGATITVDGQEAQVLGEQDKNVLLMKTAAPDKVESRKLQEVVANVNTGKKNLPTAGLISEQVANICSCYPSKWRTSCCFFSEVPEVKVGSKGAFFTKKKVALTSRTCEDSIKSLGCRTKCKEKVRESDDDRADCVLPGNVTIPKE